jgi:hypothetical protein
LFLCTSNEGRGGSLECRVRLREGKCEPVDVVLGVAVTGRVARLAMVGSPASGGEVFDQYALDLPDDAMTDLADTIVGTYRAVADSGNRVAATRLCLPDASEAETLRQTVSSAGVQNVEVVTEAEAAAALARSVGADAALLLADDDTVSLTVVGEDEESTSVLASVPIGAAGAAVACAAVLQQVPDAGATRIMLVGQRLDLDSVAAELHSTAPVEVAPDAGYAIARGAAQTVEGAGFPAGAATQMAPVSDATQMAPAASDATQMAPAAADATQIAPVTGDSAAVGPQLAYSQAEEPDFYEMPADSLEEFVPEQEDEEAYTAMIAPPPPKTLLMGSALGFVVVSFATLAVTVAIAIRPVADVEAQPVPAIQSDTVPGRYLPPVPHEPDPVALPVAVVSPPPAAPAVPRVPINRGPVTNNVPSAPPALPAPQLPPPGPAPAPQVPVVPIPPVIVFPPLNPFPTPTFPFPTPTTTVTTPTTTTTTTTTTTPTTTTPTTTTPTTTTPTTTSIVTIPAVEPPTQPPAYTPPEEPAYTPPALAPAPAPAYTPPAVAPAPAAPVIPEEPSSGSGSSSGGEGSVEVPVTTVPVSP